MSATNPKPLYDLQQVAPELPAWYASDVSFPFSNDDWHPGFTTARARLQSPEYQAVAHPVAMVIGESALAASIHLITEPTILVVDTSPAMVKHMGKYVQALREEPTCNAWNKRMIDSHPDSLVRYRYRGELGEQIERHIERGCTHPLDKHTKTPAATQKAYKRARKAAKEKAIIPWLANITQADDLAYLDHELRARDATLTLLNLTNVIPYTVANNPASPLSDSADFANILGTLPTTANIPILTTSSFFEPATRVLEPTGPFAGLDDLATRGGSSSEGPVNCGPTRAAIKKVKTGAIAWEGVHVLDEDTIDRVFDAIAGIIKKEL
jgi:hypothetical protein